MYKKKPKIARTSLLGLPNGKYGGGAGTALPGAKKVDFYRAMLCVRGTSHVRLSVSLSVCPSVRPSQVGVLLKRLNVGSRKQHHTIAQGL